MKIISIVSAFLFVSAVFAADILKNDNHACLRNDIFDKILFIKRNAYDSNHYYTEYINSTWKPKGGIFLLDTKSGTVKRVFDGISEGIVGRFDLSFDAKKIVFSYKKSPNEGYRIFVGDIESGKIKQITFPEPDETELVRKYRKHYHHGTDDLDPCWLPDGGIAFVSTRPKLGVLCDGSDTFTTTLLHRMDADGANMKQLSFGALSENSPAIMPDGRILYTRWEYVDKGASAVKALWAMRPDGIGSGEIYGLDIALPPTMIFGRPIPDEPSKFVFCGTPHYPQSAQGTVIVADVSKGTRTREAMEYITPQTDIRDECGFHFKDENGTWVFDKKGRGEIFRDPYPLSSKKFLVSVKPRGAEWNDACGYALAILGEGGKFVEIYRDSSTSCFEPYPLAERKVPHVAESQLRENQVSKGRAALLVADVYRGLENVKRGDAKYIRILEQIGRPWDARRPDNLDEFGQQHAVVSKSSHLGVKLLLGVVPVEEDGSAYFTVPANKNIFLQVLDKNFLALQTERTFANYMDGETRSCIGCHENNREVAAKGKANPLSATALRRSPSIPVPQPDGLASPRTLDYERDIQPIFDTRCVDCHNDKKFCGKLDLRGVRTKLFNVSYESLLPDRKAKIDRVLLGKVIGEIHTKITNVEYLPAGSLGARTSQLAAVFAPSKIALCTPRIRALQKRHENVRLSDAEFLRLSTWIDTNCQYYPSYWGRRNIRFKNSPDFRPTQTYESATAKTNPFKK